MTATVIPLGVIPEYERRPENSALLGEWADWLDGTGRAERTTEIYLGAIHRFLSRRYTRGRHLFEITGTEIVMHLAELGKNGPSRRQARFAMGSLFGYLHRRGWREDNPASVLEGVHERKRKTKAAPFTSDELKRLLMAANARDPRRAWAMQAIYALGARRTEFVMLRPEDIDWEARKVHFRITKGDKPRDVDIGPLADMALCELVKLGPTPKGEVGGTLLGISPSTFTGWVNQAARDCGFPPGRKRRAHTLRSTFATHLGHAGVPPEVIRDLMGHESIDTTSIYLGVYDDDGAKAVRMLSLDTTMLPGEWNLGEAVELDESLVPRP